MYIIDDTYFTGEISLPNLPVSSINEDYAEYGMAKQMQTVGENNLLTFIDSKADEYLRSFFGVKLAETISEAWAEYADCTTDTENILLTIDDSYVRNEWVSYSSTFADRIFSTFKLNSDTPEKDKRFGQIRKLQFGNEIVVDVRILPDNEFHVRVSDGVIVEPLLLKELHKRDAPNAVIRGLLNVLLSCEGSVKVSPVANYVWYWVNRDAANGTTTMGEADLNFSRATNAYETDKYLKMAAIRNKLIRAWNDMVRYNHDVIAYVNKHQYELLEYGINLHGARNLLRTQNTFNL